MKYTARLNITGLHFQQQAFFETEAEGQKVLDDFAAALRTIKEFSNRDEDPIFRYKALAASYAVDLRKTHSASLEICDDWGAVCDELSIRNIRQAKRIRDRAADEGLSDEMERVYPRLALRETGPYRELGD